MSEKEQSKKENNKIASGIGKGLAYVQATLDNTFNFLFKKMKGLGEDKNETKVEVVGEEKNEGVKYKVVKGLKKTAGFLGETGEAFYDKYEEIKTEQNKQRSSDKRGEDKK